MLHFSQLRLLWSRSSFMTSQLCVSLKNKQAEPTLQQALVKGIDTIVEDEEDDAMMTPIELLRSLPGINENNIRIVLSHITNIYELCQCTQLQLDEWIGTINGKKLYTFLRTDLSGMFV
jgi:DNA excision repair protein ERCC-4